VGAQKLARFFIEHGFDEAFGLAERDRLAIAVEGEAADFCFVALLFRFGFGEADAGDLRV